ncbi:MAG: hypothetical protein ACFFD2_21055 [Promethearchaeota archaeon]
MSNEKMNAENTYTKIKALFIIIISMMSLITGFFIYLINKVIKKYLKESKKYANIENLLASDIQTKIQIIYSFTG